MKIDEMPAGREMDKAISQYVFGNKEFVCRHSDDDYHVVNEQNGLIAYLYVPHYSINIAAAWEVVEKMEMWVVPAHDSQGDRAGWNACPYGDYSKYGATNANTAPLAICRAALKALGVEEA